MALLCSLLDLKIDEARNVADFDAFYSSKLSAFLFGRNILATLDNFFGIISENRALLENFDHFKRLLVTRLNFVLSLLDSGQRGRPSVKKAVFLLLEHI